MLNFIFYMFCFFFFLYFFGLGGGGGEGGDGKEKMWRGVENGIIEDWTVVVECGRNAFIRRV